MSGRLRVNSPVQGLAFAAAFGLGLTLAGAANAAPPADPVAKAAYDVLEKHCARCHQSGQLSQKDLDGVMHTRENPSSNFGNVMQLEEIAANPHYVLPGNAKASRLFTEIINEKMPYDWANGQGKFDPVSPEELAALEAWIDGLRKSCDPKAYVSHSDMIEMIAADIERERIGPRRKGLRYLTLTHLANACVDEKAMKVYRQATIKLLNSLSRSPDVVRFTPIDPGETIIRVNLDELGWTSEDWETILKSYPYKMQPDTSYKNLLVTSTDSKMPYVRADWFAFTASRPGMYEKLLKLAPDFNQLAKDEGVDLEGNIRKFIAQRAGFQVSGVSRNNRLIERHPSKHGYFWTSYDFADNKGRQNLYEHPLGPEGKNAFKHDGGESIFSLPNGFQAYYLNTADGKSLDKGPTNIVQDKRAKDLAVTNGISCMGCHEFGMIKAKDEIRKIALGGPGGKAFSRAELREIDGLYPENERMDKMIDADAKRFQDAMYRAGLDPNLNYNGIEMITALSQRYEQDVDLTMAAAELGMTKDEFMQATSGGFKPGLIPTIRRLQQNSVPRDQFEFRYRELAELGDEEPIDDGVQAADSKDEKAIAKVKTDADFALTSDKDTYKLGDTPVFTVVSAKDCFLTLTNIDEKDTLTVLLPNKFQQDNRIKAGVPVSFPGPKAPFIYKLGDKGKETVMAVCSEKPDVDGIKHDFNKAPLTEVKNNTRTVGERIYKQGPTRKITILPADGGSAGPGKVAVAPKASGSDLKRTAIKIDVR
jgi:mono/diheme cytochrome c family protein